MIKNVELYVNATKNQAYEISESIRRALILEDYNITNSNPDLVIGFGGDGTLLNWISTKNYITDARYIGINCGTLGFMQDFEVEDVDYFVKNIPNYIEQRLNFISLKIEVNKEVHTFYAINEFYVSNSNDKAFRGIVTIQNDLLENFVGTGLIFSTPTGSTARSLSSTGSIVYPGIEAIQITPTEPTINSKMRCLPKSICIPKSFNIKLSPCNREAIKVISDGIQVYNGMYDKIIISYSDLYMTKLTDRKSSFTVKIREKLI